MRSYHLVLVAGFLALPLAARADLIGDTVQVSYAFPTSSAVIPNTTSNVVVPGFTYVPSTGVPSGSIFLSGNSIVLTGLQPTNFVAADFNGLEFTDLTSNPYFSGAVADPLSTYAGTSAVQVTFTSNELLLNFQNTGTLEPGDVAIFDLSFAPPAAATPEPSSIALLGSGLLGTLGVMRRRFARS